MHELLMNCQPNSKDMDLVGDRQGHSVSQGAARQRQPPVHSLSLPATGLQAPQTHLLLHEVLELGDLLSIAWVLTDVIFIKEGL